MGICASGTSASNSGIDPTKPKVLVLGASGFVGQASLASLVSRHAKDVNIFAGVRNPDKFTPMEGVHVVQADMGNKAALTKVLHGFDRVFLITPGHEDRTRLSKNAIEAAHEAGVGFLLLVSVVTAHTDTIFGRQFLPIEHSAKTIGLKQGCTILRLPLFIDNNFGNAGSIKESATFYDPRNPNRRHTPIAVGDVGKAASDILASPSEHVGMTYKLAMPAFSLKELAAAFSESLGKKVTCKKVSYPATKEAFMGMGFLEWQVDGTFELFQLIDHESHITNDIPPGDFEKITGEKVTTMENWVEANKAAFQ